MLSGDWSALIASGRGGTPRLEEGPDGFSGDTSGTADRLAVTARSNARTGPHGDSIEPISKSKYRHVIASIKLLTAAAPLGSAYVAALGIAT
jgi:hypothetical protein